jgi:LAO/AO transport system kinase
MLVAVGRAGAGGTRVSVRDTGHARGAAATTSPPVERPRPKEPEVLLTTATTGAGIPELLASLDRHRARGREASDSPARLARAEAQVWAILADRLRAGLHVPANRATTDATMHRVASHELDPFAAADQLLQTLLLEDR